jgi:hypothetical protein
LKGDSELNVLPTTIFNCQPLFYLGFSEIRVLRGERIERRIVTVIDSRDWVESIPIIDRRRIHPIENVFATADCAHPVPLTHDQRQLHQDLETIEMPKGNWCSHSGKE